ncbi:hypothetical protein Scep_008086 [Stephania cephalantha]|uniref:Uncharacterized protein n=1 Tax=Stephania cephalantha TaxID=152367 RepID=A0AAP0KD01_9MAGN
MHTPSQRSRTTSQKFLRRRLTKSSDLGSMQRATCASGNQETRIWWKEISKIRDPHQCTSQDPENINGLTPNVSLNIGESNKASINGKATADSDGGKMKKQDPQRSYKIKSILCSEWAQLGFQAQTA